MPLKGFVVNGEGSDAWVSAVGKLMINFGGLELLAFYWVREFTDSPAVQDVALGLPLSRRIDLLLELSKEAHLPPATRKAFVAQWREVKEIAKLRNVFAHSPIIIGWHGPDEIGPPDEVGVLSIGHSKAQTAPHRSGHRHRTLERDRGSGRALGAAARQLAPRASRG